MPVSTAFPYSCTLPKVAKDGQGPTNAKNYKSEKPLWYSLKLLAVLPRAADWSPRGDYDNRAPITELAELCVWGPKSANGARVCASIWVHAKDMYCSGYGQAGGYGYCKASHAAYHAMASAGIEFSKIRADNGNIDKWYFDGAGMSEVEKGLQALGLALGYSLDQLYIVRVA